MAPKAQSGLSAALVRATKGVLIVGDAATPLADNSWFMIDKIAPVGSVLPIGKVTAQFKTPDNANAITPILLDDVYPLTQDSQCKVTASLSNEKGVIDVTDDCSEGYIQSITDGFTAISGAFQQFMKFDDTTKYQMVDSQSDILGRFYDIVDDDGGGTYTLAEKNDDPYYLHIYLNRKAAIGDVVNILLVPVILTTAAVALENKAGITFDVSWTKAEGWAGLYKRTLNVALDV